MKNKPISPPTLYSQLCQECQVMAEYALTSGKIIPEPVLQTVYESSCAENTATKDISATSSNASKPNKQDADGDESQPKSTPTKHQRPGFDITPLARAHQQLVTIVKPAKPETLVLLASEKAKAGWWNILGPMPIIRCLIIVAILFLVIFIAVSLSSDVTGNANVPGDNGLSLLMNELFLLAAAGLGVTFAMLFKANSAIANGTYDPRWEGSYSIKIVSGLIAGLLLAMLIPLPDTNDTFTNIFAEPLLALLGGFSSELLFRILNRLLKIVESLVTETAQRQADAQEEIVSLRTKEALAQERLSLATRVIKLQQDTANTAAKDMLKQVINELLGNDQTIALQNKNLAVAQTASTAAVSTQTSVQTSTQDG